MKNDKISVAMITLGCARNEVESDYTRASLEDGGFEIVPDTTQADVIIVNTCGFIEPAKQESINTVLELSELKESGRLRALILAGCLGQRYSKELLSNLPEVDAVLGITMSNELKEVIPRVLEGNRLALVGKPAEVLEKRNRYITPSSSAYLQIADGCDRICTYCAIPLIRGWYRSKPIENLLEEAENLISSGCKEINLVAQDITRYGLDLYGRCLLPELLAELIALGPSWIRLLYLEPDGVTDEIIEVIGAEEKICSYLDIPFQHASNRILKEMKRWGRKENYLKLIELLRREIPEIALRTSLIVGFPGENESDFKELEEFVKQIEFDYLGVFQFSPEEGTKAFSLPNRVDSSTKESRYRQIIAVQEKIREKKNRGLMGKQLEVLITDVKADNEYLLVGRSKYQAPEVDGEIYVKGKGRPSETVKVRIQKAEIYDLYGEITG